MLAAKAAGQPTGVQTAAELFSRPLTLADAINLAVHHNAIILRAEKAVAAVEGVAIQTMFRASGSNVETCSGS
jgi:hypothetical protein